MAPNNWGSVYVLQGQKQKYIRALQGAVEAYPYRHSRQHQRACSLASSTLWAAHVPTPLPPSQQSASSPPGPHIPSASPSSRAYSCTFHHSSRSLVIWMYSSIIVCTIAKDSLRVVCSSFVLGAESARRERLDRSWPVSSICTAVEFPWRSNMALCGVCCCVRTEDEELSLSAFDFHRRGYRNCERVRCRRSLSFV